MGDAREGRAGTGLRTRAGRAALRRAVEWFQAADGVRRLMRILLVAADPMEFPGMLAHATGAAPGAAGGGLGALGADSAATRRAAGGQRRRARAARRPRWTPPATAFRADAVVSTGFCGALRPGPRDRRHRGGRDRVIAGRAAFRRSRPVRAAAPSRAWCAPIDHVAQTAGGKAQPARARAPPRWRWRPPEWPSGPRGAVSPFYCVARSPTWRAKTWRMISTPPCATTATSLQCVF